MRIQSLLRASLGASILIVAGLTLQIQQIEGELNQAAQQQKIAQTIVNEVTAQLVLTLEYALYGEERALEQWNLRRKRLAEELKRFEVFAPLPRAVRYNLESTEMLTEKLVTARNSSPSSIQPLRIQLLTSQLAAHNQDLVDVIYSVQVRVDAQRTQLEFEFHHFVLIFQFSMLLLLLLLSWVLAYRVLRPLKKCYTAVKAVSQGNLKVRAYTHTKDELGDLSGVFDELAIDLVTKLQNEINVRKEVEKQLQRLATTDALTGIYNRRYFDIQLREFVARAERYQEPLCLLMFDIDHFKRINDEHGHDVGDQILRQVVEIISTHKRQVDVFARWGGEEFVMLLPKTESDKGTTLAERLRQQIESHSFSDHIHLTISIGVAPHRPGDSIDTLIKRADEALYAAKTGGRNQVVLGS